MFRLTRLKPPHGWNAVAWELGIVTLGVLIALAAQQWAEDRSWAAKVIATKAALRDELAEHYGYAIEFRVIYPCLQAQLSQLQERVLRSGTTLDAAPVYQAPDDDMQGPDDEYVVRLPWKFYPTDAWDEAIDDGIVQRFDAGMRRQLAGNYASLENLQGINAANNKAAQTLMTLRYRLPMDPWLRFNLVREIEEFRERAEWADVMNGQLIDYIEHIGMVPRPDEARAVATRYGTYQFCTAHRLPMRSFEDAMKAVPN